MSGFSVEEVLQSHIKALDEDVMSFLIAAIEDMSIDERKSSIAINEVVGPFLVDSGIVSSEEDAADIAKNISMSFGGSGYKTTAVEDKEDLPALLSAPIKMIDKTKQNDPKRNPVNALLMDGESAFNRTNYNSVLDPTAIPATQKELRKLRKEHEAMQKMLEEEAMAQAAAAAEISQARMAAIRANRATGNRQANTGVHIERFSIPHPSGTADLLTDAALNLAPHRRYGLIGKNGAGKSTLMRYIAGYKLDGLTHLRILLVDQHVEGDEYSALEWVLNADVERTSLLEDEAKLLACQRNTASEEVQKEMEGVNLEVALVECYERMDQIGVATAEARALKILQGLGFSITNNVVSSDHSSFRPTNTLSGGWAMRAALAAALFVNPNLLLLDEPTNHLDLHALVWLENWLNKHFQGIALIVSHDQCFLDAVCTDILELRSTLAGQTRSSLTHYSGDYKTFVATQRDLRVAQARQRVAYEKEVEKLKEFISREGKKYDNPGFQSQRKMKMRQLEQLMEVEQVEDESSLELRFPAPNSVFPDNAALLSCKDASFSLWVKDPNDDSIPAVERVLFKNADFRVGVNDRVAILGKNGCGKTTLLRLLMGELTPKSGGVTQNPGARITMLQQHHYKGEQLDPQLSALEHVRRIPQDETSAVGLLSAGTRLEESAQRKYLSNFGLFADRAVLPVKFLSGGQRMRVALAVALYRRPDLLILDEPTNHLDAETLQALCKALESYEGAIIAVSHDEAFVTRVITSANERAMESASTTGNKSNRKAGDGSLWVLADERVQRFEGSFKEYKNSIMKSVLKSEIAA